MFDYPDNKFFFAMTAGPVRFIFLDCGEDKSDDHREYSALNDFTGYREKQKQWLQQEVKSAAFLEAKYRILIHHIQKQEPVHLSLMTEAELKKTRKM